MIEKSQFTIVRSSQLWWDMLMEAMDSEVEIEVGIEVDLAGCEDKVNVEVGVKFE